MFYLINCDGLVYGKVCSDMKERLTKIRARGIEKEKQKLIWFDVTPAIKTFTGRTSELEELHQLVQKHIDNDSNEYAHLPIVVTGMGGVGKTQIMARYAAGYARDNDYSVVWVNSEKHEYLFESFYRLADDELNVATNNDQGKKKDIRTIVKEVYKWFHDKKCLFVFDNAQQLNTDSDGDGIIGFLPQSCPDVRFLRIVITSRNQKWGDFEVLPLSPLNDQEASEFIKKTLKITDESQDGAIEALSNTLQNLPLALQQAVSYIKKTNEEKKDLNPDKRFTIKNYLDQYEARAAGTTAVLLKYEFPNEDNANFNLKPTFTTWQTTVDKIKLLQDAKSQFALRLLNICAFCAPSRIPTEQMFLHLAQNDDQLLGESIGLLKQYSLVTTSDGCLSVHRLVQQVTRLLVKDEGSMKQVLTDVFTALHGNFPNGNSFKEIKMQRTFLPHLELVRTLVEEMLMENTTAENKTMGFVAKILDTWFDRSTKEKMELEKDRYVPLLDDLCTCYYYLGDPRMVIKVLQLQMPCIEKHYGSLTVEMAAALTRLAKAYGALGDYQNNKELLEGALAINEKHYGVDHLITARSLDDLGNVYGDCGDYEKKKELLERSLAIKEKQNGPEHIDVEEFVNLGHTYIKLGHREKAVELFERAVAKYQSQNRSDRYKNFNIAVYMMVNIANVYGTSGNAWKQKKTLEIALTALEKLYGSDHFETAIALVALGSAYGALGDSQKQKELSEKSLPILEKHYGSDHIHVGTALQNLGCAYGELGNPQKQKELLEKALSIKERHYGFDHFEVALTLMNLGNAYGVLGDHWKQKELFERSFLIKMKHYSSDHPEIATSLIMLGLANGALGDHWEHKEMLELALPIRENHYGSDHIEVSTVLISLAGICGELGDHWQQKELFERALTITEQHYGPEHLETTTLLIDLANAHGKLGDTEKRIELIETALDIHVKFYGCDHIRTAITLEHLGLAYEASMDYMNAKICAQKALSIFRKHIEINDDRFMTVMRLLVRVNHASDV